MAPVGAGEANEFQSGEYSQLSFAIGNLQWLNCVLGTSNNLTLQIPKVLLPKCHLIQMFLFCEMPSIKIVYFQTNQNIGGKQMLLREHLNCNQQMKRPEVLHCSFRVLFDNGSLLLVLKLEKKTSSAVHSKHELLN